MDELFTPTTVIDWYTTQEGITIDEMGVAPIAVVSWGKSVIESLAEMIGAQAAEHWLYADRHRLFKGQVEGLDVSLAHLPVGSPGTVMMMEEMIACGARTIIGLGWAGSLQPTAPIGCLLIPTSCVSEEGTSAHYDDGNLSLTPAADLANALEKAAIDQGAQVVKGPLWTTDAPYRELRSKVRAYRSQGVLGVDMETSAMYALGSFRHIKVCNLLVVSDELADEWRPAFRTPQLRAANEKAMLTVLHLLSSQVPI
jgi:uridine phosphorylase